MAFWGGIAIVIGAASTAYANILIKARETKFAAPVMAAWQMIFALVPLIALGLCTEGNPIHFHWTRLAIACLLAAAFTAYSIKLVYQSNVFHDISTGNDATPLWIPQIAMAVGTFVLLIAFVDELVLEIQGRRVVLLSEEMLHNE